MWFYGTCSLLGRICRIQLDLSLLTYIKSYNSLFCVLTYRGKDLQELVPSHCIAVLVPRFNRGCLASLSTYWPILLTLLELSQNCFNYFKLDKVDFISTVKLLLVCTSFYIFILQVNKVSGSWVNSILCGNEDLIVYFKFSFKTKFL